MDLADLVNKNPELFTREDIEELNRLVIIGADKEVERIVNEIIKERS